MKRHHLTESEKGKIARMTLKGMRQSEIARQLGIGRDSISKAQRAMGLPTRVVIPEDKIMELFHQGWGGYRIARHLSVAVSAVYKVAHKNKFRRPDNVGYPTDPVAEARLIEGLKNREDYAKRLAKKYKVGICKSVRLAHQVLECPEFRPGASKPPLSSNFPQKHFDVSADSDTYIKLVKKIVDVCYGGKLLAEEHDQIFVAACVKTFPAFQGQTQVVLDCLASNLRSALATIRASDAAKFLN